MAFEEDDFEIVASAPRWQGHISLDEVEIKDPDGNHFNREVVRRGEAVAAVPIVAAIENILDGKPLVQVALVHQYRAAFDEYVEEIPAGMCDVAGESPENAIARELEEEIGRTPTLIDHLGDYYSSPGFTDEMVHLYVAYIVSAEHTTPQDFAPKNEEKHMYITYYPIDYIPTLLRGGTIKDGKTLLGLHMAYRWAEVENLVS